MVIELISGKETELRQLLLENGFSSDYAGLLLREKKNVFINGKEYSRDYLLKKGDVVTINIGDETCDIIPSDKDPDVVFEDEYILAVYKESGLASVPTIRHYVDNLSSRVARHYLKTGQKNGIHVINRLDFETKGLVVFAKNRFVCNLLKNTKIDKVYTATVVGQPDEKEGIVDRPIYKDGKNKKRIIDVRGKRAITAYRVVLESEGTSLLEFRLKTGRTHQIRVHMASLGHPLVGDPLYGSPDGQFDLCCREMHFDLSIFGRHYDLHI